MKQQLGMTSKYKQKHNERWLKQNKQHIKNIMNKMAVEQTNWRNERRHETQPTHKGTQEGNKMNGNGR